jgi:hypothetical protein
MEAAAAATPQTRIRLEGDWWCKPLQRPRDDGKFLDVTVVVGGRRIAAHRAVLVGMSPFFDGLLTSGFSESNQGGMAEVELGGGDSGEIDGGAVEVIVDCMYSGELVLSSDTVGSVICTANLLGVDAVERAACDFLVESLCPCSACEALVFAERCAEGGEEGRRLHKRCVEYLVSRFSECSAEQSFLDLPCQALVQVVNHDSLPAEAAKVLEKVSEWYNHDAAARQQCLKELMPAVRSLRIRVCTSSTCNAGCRPTLHPALLADEVAGGITLPARTGGGISLSLPGRTRRARTRYQG